MNFSLFMSLYTLLNLYIYFIAYLYAPCIFHYSDVKSERDYNEINRDIKIQNGEELRNISDQDKPRVCIINDLYGSEFS